MQPGGTARLGRLDVRAGGRRPSGLGYFNNDIEAHAIADATALKAMLGED